MKVFHWQEETKNEYLARVQAHAKADPDFVKACMKLIREKLEGKINQKQFLERYQLLEQATRTMK